LSTVSRTIHQGEIQIPMLYLKMSMAKGHLKKHFDILYLQNILRLR
jgi:hypothetical protein